MKKTVIVDGNSLLFRAYYSTAYSGSLMTNKDGIPTNAIFSFHNFMKKIKEMVSLGDHLFVAFDFGKDTKLMDTAFQNYMNAAIGEINAILENVAINLKHYQDVKNVRTGAQICKLMAKKVD